MAKRMGVVNKQLDRFLAHTFVYTALVFVLLRVHKAAHFEQVLYSALGIESSFPLLRVLVYTVCAGVYAMWIFRWWRTVRCAEPLSTIYWRYAIPPILV